jgi:hypothetical protein
MAGPRRKKAASPRGKARDVTPSRPPDSPAPERECWLCAKPLTDGITTSMLGRGVFEVHRRCYDESLGIKPRI